MVFFFALLSSFDSVLSVFILCALIASIQFLILRCSRLLPAYGCVFKNSQVLFKCKFQFIYLLELVFIFSFSFTMAKAQCVMRFAQPNKWRSYMLPYIRCTLWFFSLTLAYSDFKIFENILFYGSIHTHTHAQIQNTIHISDDHLWTSLNLFATGSFRLIAYFLRFISVAIYFYIGFKWWKKRWTNILKVGSNRVQPKKRSHLKWKQKTFLESCIKYESSISCQSWNFHLSLQQLEFLE